MNTRATFAVALSILVLLSGAGLVVGVGENAERAQEPSDAGAAAHGPENVAQDYEVTIDNVTINTWLLRNSTVKDATVREVTIENATTPDGSQENVTLENVSVGEFVLDRARLKNVTAEKLTVRNKSVLDVPGGDFFDPDVEDRTIDRHWTRNQTVSGVVIDTIVIDAAIMEENASLGPEADDGGEFSGEDDGEADINVQNGTVGEALVIYGEANDWSVGSTSGVDDSGDSNGSEESGDSDDSNGSDDSENSDDSDGSDDADDSDDSERLSPAAIETEA